MKVFTFCTMLVFCGLLFTGCNDDETNTAIVEEDDSDFDTEFNGNFKSEYFTQLPLREELVSCTLENGSETTCYELSFLSNTVGDTEDSATIGPFCSSSVNSPRDEAGLVIYDGPTNPGFQSVIDAAISMDLDGYDIIDEEGNIRFSDLTPDNEPEEGFSYCLSGLLDSSLEVTFLIPVSPEFREEPAMLGTVESVGVSIDGIPFKASPPSVTIVEEGVRGTGSGNIPPVDFCGGHSDPAGYYHWHFTPESINTVLESESYNFTQLYGISCRNSLVVFDNPSAFSGLAKDGFPIYAAYDSIDAVDMEPNEVVELDECNGHTHATNEYSDGVYHYHAYKDSAPNLPVCLMGSFVQRDFMIQ